MDDSDLIRSLRSRVESECGPDRHTTSAVAIADFEDAVHLRACDDPAWRTPKGLLHLCNWGCGIFSYVDTLSPHATVVTAEAFDDRIEYTETAPTLAGWLSDWLAGVNLEGTMYEIVGYRDGINPFTGKPLRLPIRKMQGRRIDFAGRDAD
jgi:hypothetical protein